MSSLAVRSPSRGGVALIATAVVAGAAAVPLAPAAVGDGEVWAFLLAAAVGELIVLDDVRGNTAATSLAVLAAFTLLGAGPVVTTAVAAGAWVAAAGIRSWRGGRPRLTELVERALAAWTLAGLATLGALVQPQWTVGTDGAGTPVGAIVAVLGGLLAGPAVWQLPAADPSSGGPDLTTIRRGSGVAVALGASAALVAVAYGPLGAGALLLLLPPVLAVRAGLARYGEIRRTYDQTVVAMSRMTELTGHAERGHGVRVAELAVELGQQLGLADRDLKVLERAGHLHELGRIVTDDPDRAARDREVAVAGAAIVREAGGMDGVADVIERHRDAYRSAGRAPDDSLPLASRIVHTSCEYDRLAHGGERWAALDAVQHSTAHDPEVVSALVRVVGS